MNHVAANNYILDLDPMNYADAYFYNAMASYSSTRSKTLKRALSKRNTSICALISAGAPLIGGDLARKDHYAVAIAQMQTYLALAPMQKTPTTYGPSWQNWKKLNTSPPTTEKLNQR